jgi:hypothetical protein
LILFTLSAVPESARAQQDDLAGRWRSTEVSPSGVSSIFEFHGDNRMDSYSAAISEGRYRLVGTDTILFQTKNGEEKQEVEWDSQDRARIEDEAAGKYMNLARIGKTPDDKNPLIGEWNTTREWNGAKYPARVWFFADGRVLWVATLRTEHGRYSVQSKNIRLEIAGRPAVEGTYALSGDRLTLPNPKGGGSSFDRF